MKEVQPGEPLVWNKSGLDWIQANSWTILWVYKGLLPTFRLLANFLPFLTSVKWHWVRPLLELTKAPRYANRRSLSEPRDPGQVIAHRPQDIELSRDGSLRKFEALLNAVRGQRGKQKSTTPQNQWSEPCGKLAHFKCDKWNCFICFKSTDLQPQKAKTASQIS